MTSITRRVALKGVALTATTWLPGCGGETDFSQTETTSKALGLYVPRTTPPPTPAPAPAPTPAPAPAPTPTPAPTPAAPVLPLTTKKYRQQQDLLFQRYSEKVTRLKYVNRTGKLVDTGINYFNDGSSDSAYRFGPNKEFVCGNDMWPWANMGGDFIDAAGVQQGGTPFSTLTIPVAQHADGMEVPIDVTSLLANCYANGRWIVVFLKMTKQAGHINIAGSLAKPGARIDVKYEDGSTESLGIWVVASMMSTFTTNAMDDSVQMRSDTVPAVLEFFPPANRKKVIKSATMFMPVVSNLFTSGSTTFQTFICSPPVQNLSPQSGLASSYWMDAGIEYSPGYITGNVLVRDTTQIGEVLDTVHSSYSYSEPYTPGSPPVVTQHAEAQFDPSLWGNKGDPHLANVKWPTAAQEAQLLPARAHRRWVGKTSADRFSVVRSNDPVALAKGFAPLAPGLGAIQITMPADKIESGQMWRDGLTKSTQDVKLYFPKKHIGRVKDMYMRFYIRLGNGWQPAPGDDRFHMLGTTAQMGKYPEEVGVNWDPAYTRRVDRKGKFFGGAGQQTRLTAWRGYVDPKRVTSSAQVVNIVDGGNSESGGAVGHSGRFWFREGLMDPTLPGPAKGGLVLIFGPQDYRSPYHSIDEYRNQMLTWGSSWQTGSTRYGGLGHLYPYKWYCVEFRFKANSLKLPYQLPPAGTHFTNSGYLVDGKVEFWIDGIKAGMSPDFAFRTSRAMEWALQANSGVPFGSSGTMRPITNVPPEQYMGLAHLIGDPYYGGKSPNPREKVWWMNGLVVSDRYIGPMAGLSRENGGLGT